MTDAFVSRNITKNNAIIETEQNTDVTQSDKQKIVPGINIACNCNTTNSSNQNKHLECTNSMTAEDNVKCINETVQNSEYEVKNKNSKNANVSDSNDTILKYVYKKNETKDSGKPKSHYKNSLRKKRSPIDSKLAQNAPLIVNYETSHTPVQDKEQWLPAKHTTNIIKSSDLADFNIETLHENERGDGELQNNDRTSSADSDGLEENSGEINRNINDKKRGESSENNNDTNESKSQEKDNSNEKDSRTNDNSRENRNLNNISYESVQNDDKSTESREHERDYDDDEPKPNLDNEKFTKARTEESTESSERSTENSEEFDKNTKTNSSPHQIQIDDLGDNSYEKTKQNKNREEERARDENNAPTIKPRPFAKIHDKSNDHIYEGSDSSSHEANEPTHFNDGEVKPVVEINTESGSNESNEDSSSWNNENLETLTGVNDEKHDKLQEDKESQNVGDVKQQFERVPLNYNHANQKQIKIKDTKQNKHFESKDDDGTVDKLLPTNVRYDENLNIKFDDIAIKLPEIKLPEDILSYAYEDPPIYKNKGNKKKTNFFHYNSDEDKEDKEIREESDNGDEDVSEYHNDEDDSNNHYGFYDKTKRHQAYKNDKNVVNKEEDDPYEKFVRERFGKRDTFEKRSEKLRDLSSYNPQLYRKVQNILEKTKNVKKEAVKSGDPNAGYMWTLEYGQKL